YFSSHENSQPLLFARLKRSGNNSTRLTVSAQQENEENLCYWRKALSLYGRQSAEEMVTLHECALSGNLATFQRAKGKSPAWYCRRYAKNWHDNGGARRRR